MRIQQFLGSDSKPVPGLYTAGEVAGGVHGNNRFGRIALMDCVVFVLRISRQLGFLLVFLVNRIWSSMLLARELFCLRFD